MFCCTICGSMFTGVYPEVIVTTPCGHIFHRTCIQICLKKKKCPSCNTYFNQSRLVRLHFQIDKNWKDTISSFKSKANSSVIDLDETLNETLRIENSGSLINKSLVKKNSNESVIEVPNLPISGDKHLHIHIHTHEHRPCISGPKTLLTTLLSGVSSPNDNIPPRIQNLLLILNEIIPNSIVKIDLLMTENKLLQIAAEKGFTNILIINVLLGYPVGLYFFDILNNIKTKVLLKSYECLEYEKLECKIKAPPIAIKENGKLNKLQKFVLNFFTTICKKRFQRINEEEIHITCDYSHIEVTYNLAGLRFWLITPSCNTVLKEINF